MDLICCNATKPTYCKWLTLTYADAMIGNNIINTSLQNIEPSITEDYYYDIADRLTKRSTILRIDDQNVEERSSLYLYDNNGNVISDGEFEYSYNGFNQMVYAKSAEGQTLACRYDAENLRYEIEENQELVRFIYNSQREVFTELNTNDTIRYIRGRNIISSDSVNAQTYYHYSCDEMGSITEVIDAGCSERTVLNHYQYDAFGLVTEGYENTLNRFKWR